MRPSVIIIGGGFAGLTVAQELDDRAEVLIVSDQNFLLFTPMLAEVASGDLDPRHIVTPLRDIVPRARVISGTVESVDLESHSVKVRRPFGLDPLELSADALVVAVGSVPATFGTEGVEEWALSFKTIGDALRIRNRVLALLESATEEIDPSLTHLAIVGAGYSGAELAAAMADFIGSAARRYFPSAPRPRVTLIDALDRVAPTLPTRLSAAAERALARRGVDVLLGEKVRAVTPDGLELESGRTIDARTVVWAAGVTPHPLAEELGLPLERGRIVVDCHLEAAPGVFALGDVAAVPDGKGRMSPPTAQFAIRQGRYLGRNLPRILSGRRASAFRHRGMGELVSLGHRNAVGQVMGLRVSGFVGWFAWRAYYLSRLPSWLRKVRVGMDWALDLLFPPDVSSLPSQDLGPQRDRPPKLS
ncbi:hypothetical protein BH23ACT5_BH23ACT5_11880 [soil metagenome]